MADNKNGSWLDSHPLNLPKFDATLKFPIKTNDSPLNLSNTNNTNNSPLNLSNTNNTNNNQFTMTPIGGTKFDTYGGYNNVLASQNSDTNRIYNDNNIVKGQSRFGKHPALTQKSVIDAANALGTDFVNSLKGQGIDLNNKAYTDGRYEDKTQALAKLVQTEINNRLNAAGANVGNIKVDGWFGQQSLDALNRLKNIQLNQKMGFQQDMNNGFKETLGLRINNPYHINTNNAAYNSQWQSQFSGFGKRGAMRAWLHNNNISNTSQLANAIKGDQNLAKTFGFDTSKSGWDNDIETQLQNNYGIHGHIGGSDRRRIRQLLDNNVNTNPSSPGMWVTRGQVPTWLNPTIVKFQKQGGMINFYQDGGQVQDDPQQKIIALVQAAQQGDQQAQQTIQQIQQAAQQGDQQAAQIMQLIQQITQQMQQQVQAARHGAKLNYLASLRGYCPQGSHLEFFKVGGQICKKCMQNKVQEDKCGGKAKKQKMACGGVTKGINLIKAELGNKLKNKKKNHSCKK